MLQPSVWGIRYAQASRLKGSDAGLGEMIPYTLIAGLFLSNFPEALSSSVAMHDYGWSKMRVLLMWTSLTVCNSFFELPAPSRCLASH